MKFKITYNVTSTITVDALNYDDAIMTQFPRHVATSPNVVILNCELVQKKTFVVQFSKTTEHEMRISAYDAPGAEEIFNEGLDDDGEYVVTSIKEEKR
jgi:hypothetical protein